MSPCTAKLSAFRSKQVGKYVITPSNPNQTKPNQCRHKSANRCFHDNRGKPKSLFAQASAKKLEAGGINGDALFGSKPAPGSVQNNNPFGTN
jgi:hypothetical protein